MRPKQWTKNLLLFAGIIFSQNVANFTMLTNAILSFVIFCVVSGGMYIVNDIRDIEQDREHPQKRFRPVASGALSVSTASVVAFVIILLGVILAFTITIYFGCCVVTYIALILLYSYWLKHLVIIDVIVVALGFVIRAIAGIEAIRIPGVEVAMTGWFLSCTFFLALFLAICKRRHEYTFLNEKAENHRKVLLEYSIAFIDQMVAVVTSATVISYAIWTTSGELAKGRGMVYTIPFVIYGIFRYLYIVYKKEVGGAPEKALFNDKYLMVNILLWMIAILLILYFRH